MTATTKQAALETPQTPLRPSGWRTVVDFAAIGAAGYAVWALLGAAREDRLQRDVALSEQRRLRLAMRDLNDKLAALSTVPIDGAPVVAANSLNDSNAAPDAGARRKSTTSRSTVSKRAAASRTSRTRQSEAGEAVNDLP